MGAMARCLEAGSTAAKWAFVALTAALWVRAFVSATSANAPLLAPEICPEPVIILV